MFIGRNGRNADISEVINRRTKTDDAGNVRCAGLELYGAFW